MSRNVVQSRRQRGRSAASVGRHLIAYADDTATDSAYSDALSLALQTEKAESPVILQEALLTTDYEDSKHVFTGIPVHLFPEQAHQSVFLPCPGL